MGSALSILVRSGKVLIALSIFAFGLVFVRGIKSWDINQNTLTRIETSMKEGAICRTDQDCTVTASCELGCGNALNVKTVKALVADKTAMELLHERNFCEAEINPTCTERPVACVNNRCEVVSKVCQNDYNCENLYCSIFKHEKNLSRYTSTCRQTSGFCNCSFKQ